jgi:hypothetical protein
MDSCFYALLFKAKSLDVFHHFKSPFIVFFMSTLFFSCLSFSRYRSLGSHYALMSMEFSIGCSNHLNHKLFFQLVLLLAYNVYHCSKLDSFLYGHKFNVAYTFLQHLSVEHVVFCRLTFRTI